MTTPLPAPLVPPDVDLRDFGFLPLDVVRLRDSDLVSLETAEAFRAAVLLWCASWHQEPAASLPDDDRVLARLAGYGFVVEAWKAEREGALRGWIKCSDGRLYHPVLAEKAADAWRGKMGQRWKTECSRIKKYNQRHGTAHLCPDFDQWLSLGCPQGQMLHVHKDTPPLSPKPDQGQHPIVPEEKHSKGQGEGEGQGQGYIKEKSTAMSGNAEPDLLALANSDLGTQAPAKTGVQAQALEVLAFLNLKTGRDYQPVASNMVLIKARLKEGATVDDMRMVIAKKVRDWTPDDRMREYLRPATLFNATKFAQYRGELVVTTET